MTIAKETRSLKLIANFVDGYAEGWAFAVSEAFKDRLDIRYTQRIENKQKVMRWIQGPYFCFERGDTLYDSIEAYQKWGDVLKHFTRMCQVVEGSPLKNEKLVEAPW